MWRVKSVEDKGLAADATRPSAEEYAEMMEHVEHCPECQHAWTDFTSSLKQMPEKERENGKRALLSHIKKGGLEERFIERARAEGIHFSPASESRFDLHSPSVFPQVSPFRWVAVGAVLGMVVVGIGFQIGYRGARRPLDGGTQAQGVQLPPPSGPTNHELAKKISELQAAMGDSTKTVSRLEGENASYLLQVGGLERELAASQAEKEDLQESLTRLSELNAKLAAQNDQNAQLLARTRSDLEAARAHGQEMEAEMGAEKAEVGSLEEQYTSQTAILNRDRELLTAGRDITDLVGARNLHIIDVHDAYGRGKSSKSFGRIFYTEGKSLVFYAYDLDERKLADGNYAFEVWGERLGEPNTVRQLGILYTDDKDHQRWMVKVDDAQQLAEIDSVFVTLQRHGAGNKPLGQKILFAFLGGKANHP